MFRWKEHTSLLCPLQAPWERGRARGWLLSSTQMSLPAIITAAFHRIKGFSW